MTPYDPSADVIEVIRSPGVGPVAGAYRTFGDFEKFAAVSRLYFAAAIWSETKRRLGQTPPGFLLSDDVTINVNLEAQKAK